MSQNSLVLPTTGTVSGLTMTQDTNAALDTLNTLAAGTAAPSSPEAAQLWHNTSNNTVYIYSLDSTTWIPLFVINETAYTASPYTAGSFGQCQFQYSSATTTILMPFKGNKVTFPSGIIALIGSSGISAIYNNCSFNGTAAQTLSASTHYYAYLWFNGTNYVIDFSTTGHSTDTSTGIEVKSGDSTRVLVGQVYTNGSGQFQSSASQQMVRSWFNDPGTFGSNSFTTNRTYGTNAYAEINSEIRINILPWAGETVEIDFRAAASLGTTGNNITNAIGIDSTSSASGMPANALSPGTNFICNLSQIYRTTALSEIQHFVTLLGLSNNAVTITWASAYTTLSVKCCGSPV